VSQLTERHRGVIQWDYGKTESEQKFVCKSILNKPPSVLLHAVQALKVHACIRGLDIQGALDVMREKYCNMERKYIFQGAENNQLFMATYNHPSGDNCDGCDPALIETRPT
jgi:hypothetical protein